MENEVRFYDGLTDEELQNAVYENLVFRGRRVLRRREEEFKNLLISSSFCAWQILSAKGVIRTDWKTYLQHLNLIEQEPIAKGQLKKEYKEAIAKSERIIENAKKRIKDKK